MLEIVWQQSGWYWVMCLFISLGLSYLLYSKKDEWNSPLKYILTSIRWAVLFLILILILAPLIKLVKEQLERPILVLAIDNSQSLAATNQKNYTQTLQSELSTLADKLTQFPVDIKIHDFNGQISAAEIAKSEFAFPSSNLNVLLKDIQQEYSNNNLAGIILASDGIFNKGTDPTYTTPLCPVFTIGLGDTSTQSDISIQAVYTNKISYLGSKYPLVVEVSNNGFKGKKININIVQEKKTIAQHNFSIASDKGLSQIKFEIPASKTGIQHLVINIEPVSGEYSLRNNQAHAYTEVIDNKEKILIVASSPHPDINAISAALKSKEGIEVNYFIPSVNNYKEDQYDVIIFYQVPSFYKYPNDILNKILAQSKASIYIVGSTSNLNELNKLNPEISLNAGFGKSDLVTPAYNDNFEKFQLDESEQRTVSLYPPVYSPYGVYNIAGTSNFDILLYQKIGNTSSKNPLIGYFQNQDKKAAYIFAEGLWQWRISEIAENGNSNSFDKIINNITQLVSAKEDKRRFRCHSTSKSYSGSEVVKFDAETYNNIFQKIYQQKIDIELISDGNKKLNYSFTNSESNSIFEINGLEEGLYRYTTSTSLSGKKEICKGEFTIQKQDLELINTNANHNLLKRLAHQSGAEFYVLNDVSKLLNDINTIQFKSKLKSSENLMDLINWYWILILLIALISTEWFIRKYKGAY